MRPHPNPEFLAWTPSRTYLWNSIVAKFTYPSFILVVLKRPRAPERHTSAVIEVMLCSTPPLLPHLIIQCISDLDSFKCSSSDGPDSRLQE